MIVTMGIKSVPIICLPILSTQFFRLEFFIAWDQEKGYLEKSDLIKVTWWEFEEGKKKSCHNQDKQKQTTKDGTK